MPGTTARTWHRFIYNCWWLFAVGATMCPNRAQADLILNGGFSLGNIGFSSDYSFVPDPEVSLTPGTFAVRSDPQAYNFELAAFGDHTTGDGNMLLVDGWSSPTRVAWAEVVTVLPNTRYAFTAWAASSYFAFPSTLRFEINDVPVGADLALTSTTGLWTVFNAFWDSQTAGQAILRIRDLGTVTEQRGNDFALDDISFARGPPTGAAVPAPGTVAMLGSAALLAAFWHLLRR